MSIKPVVNSGKEDNFFVHVRMKHYFINFIYFFQQINPSMTFSQVNALLIIILQKFLYFDDLSTLRISKFDFLFDNKWIIWSDFKYNDAILIKYKDDAITNIFYIFNRHLLTKNTHELLVIELVDVQVVSKCYEFIIDEGVVRNSVYFVYLVVSVVNLFLVIH